MRGASGDSAARAVGYFVAVPFAVAMIGPNLANPLMPLYAGRFRLDAWAQGAAFAVYLSSLVIVVLAAEVILAAGRAQDLRPVS